MSLTIIQCDGYSVLYGDPNSTYGKCALVEPNDSAMAVIPSPVFEIWGTDKERRCFDFFLNRTAPQLSGFWDSDFWGCLILQATHHQSAIRHAVLALGALHERFEAGDTSVKNPIWDKGTFISESIIPVWQQTGVTCHFSGAKSSFTLQVYHVTWVNYRFLAVRASFCPLKISILDFYPNRATLTLESI